MEHGGESSNHLESNTNASCNTCESLGPLISVVESDPGSGSRTNSEIKLEEIEIGHGSDKSSDSSDTASSSSSNSSSGDFFQVIPHRLPKYCASIDISKPNGATKPLYTNDKVDVSSEALYRLEESINESPESIARFSDITHESFVPYMSPIQSPPIQLMERSGGFDPHRIPTSIFSKPLAPMEWSVASNESLFSIHIGNHSFSRGQASRISKDLYRSGELPQSGELFKPKQLYESGELFKSGELYQSEELYYSGDPKRTGELSGFGQASTATKEVRPYKNLNMAKVLGKDIMKPITKGVTDAPTYDVSKARINHGDRNLGDSKDSISANRLPDGSVTIVRSVAFAIEKKSACPFCHCSSCSRMFCFCKWLSCSCSCCCKWRNCCCKWQSCPWMSCWPSCSCKFPSCPSSHFKCPSLPSCCCKCSMWPSCCCDYSSWPSCKCHCAYFGWLCCDCWKRKPNTSCYDSSYILTDGGMTSSKMAYPSSIKTSKSSSSKQSSCFSCLSSCSCFSCCSCSCCC